MQDAEQLRRAMVDNQVAARGIRDSRVLAAMRDVPRHAFLPAASLAVAYADHPQPIACDQTISQPYVVALMIEAAEIGPADHVLEVGAGCGYAAAVMGRIAVRVHAIERHEALATAARETLASLGCDNVEIVAGDGTLGLPHAAPFDAIVVSAGGREVPAALLAQLAPGGRLVMPVGGADRQQLMRYRREPDGRLTRTDLGAVVFVPLIG